MTLFRCKPTPKQRPTMLSTISIQAIDDELEKYQPAKAWDYLMDLNANPVIGVLDAWREHYPSLVEKYRQRLQQPIAQQEKVADALMTIASRPTVSYTYGSGATHDDRRNQFMLGEERAIKLINQI